MVLKMEMTDLMSKQQTTQSKYEGLWSATAAELMIGFWLGTGVILAVKMVDSQRPKETPANKFDMD